MKRIIIAAAAMLAATAASADVDDGADSAGSYLSYCRPVAAGAVDANGFISFAQNRETAQCWGLFTAMQHLIAVGEGGAPVMRVCAPDSSRRNQLVSIFVKYASDHPEMLHLSAGQVALMALRAAFPCPNDIDAKIRKGIEEIFPGHWIRSTHETHHHRSLGIDACDGSTG